MGSALDIEEPIRVRSTFSIKLNNVDATPMLQRPLCYETAIYILIRASSSDRYSATRS